MYHNSIDPLSLLHLSNIKETMGAYGSKKAHEREHIKTTGWKIARIMKENGLIAKGDRKKAG